MTTRQTILAVDDEEDILELVNFHLSREGYSVTTADTGESALAAANQHPPALILLDLMLPGIDGLEVARRLRRQPGTAEIPIIMLTAKGEEADVVAGLELGADDYITKPFSPRVLVARVKSVLRRRAVATRNEEASVIYIHGIAIHLGTRRVEIGDERIDLTYTEFEVLHTLARRPGWVFTRSQIVDSVRGSDYPVTDRSVDVQIVGLRKKLGAQGDIIETVRGVGYRLREE